MDHRRIIPEGHSSWRKGTSPWKNDTFEIVWRNGAAGTHFTVARNTSGNNDGNNNGNNNSNNNSSDNAGSSDGTADTTVIAPKTGDASRDALLVVLAVVSFAGLAGMLVLKKKNAYK